LFLSYDTVEAFAVKRNPSLSFPFLKENGELLAIAVNSGFLIDPRGLDLYMDFYSNAHKLTEVYPQYYRFTLGMISDLEIGGINGTQGQKIADYVTKENLFMFDTSDVRRLETLTMLGKMGPLSALQKQLYCDIVERVEIFVQNPSWYAKFNKPLFYDLTHIIFFLTDFGRTPISFAEQVHLCLMHIGVLALLDNDADLLSEVGMCLKYIGYDVPEYWDTFLTERADDILITFDGNVASALNPTVDEYHLYLVSNAYLASQEKLAFSQSFRSQTPSFSVSEARESVLSKLSAYSHAHYFQSQAKGHSLEGFIAGLDSAERDHWQNIMKSSALGEEIVCGFSGLAYL